jgi:hypothetical protein
MTYNLGCDSTAQPMRAGGSGISQRAGSQGSWTTGLLHINGMGSDQASDPHPRVWPLSRIAPGRSHWADAGTVSGGSPSPARCGWSQQPRPGSGVRGGRQAGGPATVGESPPRGRGRHRTRYADAAWDVPDGKTAVAGNREVLELPEGAAP